MKMSIFGSLVIVALFMANIAHAAPLTPAELAVVKNDILVDHASVEWTDIDNNNMLQTMSIVDWATHPGGTDQISNWYASLAVPTVQVWREDMHHHEMSEAVLYSELLTLTEVEVLVYNLILGRSFGQVNAASQNVRDGLADVLSGAARATSRNNLLALGMRPATWAEALFSTGPVQGAVVAKYYGDNITSSNIDQALLLP